MYAHKGKIRPNNNFSIACKHPMAFFLFREEKNLSCLLFKRFDIDDS